MATQTPTAALRIVGIASVRTRTPFGRTVRRMESVSALKGSCSGVKGWDAPGRPECDRGAPGSA